LLITALAVLPQFLSGTGKSTASSSTITNIDDDDDEYDEDNIITEDIIVSVFDSLFVHMQGVISQLGQQIQQIQMSGQAIPEKQLRQLLKAEFERALVAQQSKVYEANDVDEECFEEATWEILQDESNVKAHKAVERFQKLYERISGETVASPAGTVETNGVITAEAPLLSQQKLLTTAQVYFDALTASMAAVVQTYKDKGANLFDPVVAQQLQLQFGKEANESGEKVLANMGVTQETFRRSIEKYANNPEVARALAMLQMKQQQELMAMGVPAM